MKKKELYKIFYKKYSVYGGAYVPYILVVETADIYHEVGKLICTSIEEIKDIWYGTAKHLDKSIAYWESRGYRRISDSSCWVLEQGQAK